MIVSISDFRPACELRILRGLNDGRIDISSTKPAYKEFLREVAFIDIRGLPQTKKGNSQNSKAYDLRCSDVEESSCMLAFPYDNSSLVRVQFSKIHAPEAEKIRELAKRLVEKLDSGLPLLASGDEGLFEQYRRQATKGDSRAQFMLGFFYESGQGVAKSDKEAAKWYSKAAEQGIGQAQFSLGAMYQEGRGVSQDYEAAYFWKAVAEKNRVVPPEHWREEAELHLKPEQIAELQRRVSEWKRPAPPLTPEGIAKTAVEEEKQQEEMARMRVQADDGVEASQFRLGETYLAGKGVKQDFEQAFFWLSLAEHRMDKKRLDLAEQAKGHLTPEKIAVVHKRKIQWWLEAAKSGVPYASAEGVKWYEGVKNDMGFPLDCQEAQFWLSVSSLGGSVPAGPCGHLSTTDYSPEMQQRLEQWEPACIPGRKCVNTSRISKAAHGDPEEQYQEGARFEYQKNYSEAIRWYQRALRQGNGDSAMSLAGFYMRGIGVPVNSVEAYYLMLLARKAGTKIWSGPPADKDPSLKKLASQLTAEQHMQVQKRLDEWKPISENAK